MDEDAIRRIRAVGAASAAYSTIEIDLADQRRLAAVALELMMTSLSMGDGEPRPGMIVSEPTGAGKSKAAARIVREAALLGSGAEPGEPARLITLDTVGSVKSLWSSVLEGLGDPNWESGSEPLQRKRVHKALRRLGVHLLIIDEFNHVAEASQSRRGLNALKNLLTDGWTSILVLGTSEELDALPANEAFERRMARNPGLPARSWSGQGEVWRSYLGRLEDGIVDRRILNGRLGLEGGAVARAMCSLCEGMIGDADWIVHESLKDAVRRNADAIQMRDLIANGDALLRKRRRGGINPLGALR